ncbi:MAG: hypothetical protein RL336_374 [Pseudomonadota bacterium]
MFARRLFFSIFLVVFCQSVSSAPQLPLETFTRHGDYLDVVISPDGKHLATRMRQGEKVMLVIMRTADHKIVGGIDPKGDNIVHSITWVNNERLVYELAQQHLGNDRPTATGELFGINIDNTQSGLLYGYRASANNTIGSLIKTTESEKASQEILNVLPGDDDNILIIEYPWEQIGRYYYDNHKRAAIVSKLNVYTGRKRRVDVLSYPNVKAIANDQGEVKFITWGDVDGNRYSAVRDGEEAWRSLDVDYPFEDEPAVIGLSRDEKYAYLYGAEGEQQLNNLFQLDLKNGAVVPLFDGLRSDIETWTIDETTGAPTVGISFPGKPSYHYSALGESSMVNPLYKMLLKAFNGQKVDVWDFSRDQTLAIVRVSSDINPGEFYIFNTQTKRADFIWANGSWIDINQMRPMEALEISVRDGLNIHAYLTLPEIKDDKSKVPLIVMPHGGPHFARDYWQFDADVQLFANRGYAVLQVNFRGSDGYGDAFHRAGFHQWGQGMIHDIADVTRHVVETRPIDGERMCIYGVSYGGYASLMSAAIEPDLFRCAIGSGGVYDLKQLHEEGLNLKHFGGREFLQRTLGTDVNELDNNSPVYLAEKIKANVMLIHGMKDEIALPEHAELMREKLQEAGKKVRWLVYDRAGHGIWDAEDRTEMFAEVLDFLGESLAK